MLSFLMPYMWKWFKISDIQPHWLFGHDWNIICDTGPNGEMIPHDTMRCPCGATKEMTEQDKRELSTISIIKCEACFLENTEAKHIH